MYKIRGKIQVQNDRILENRNIIEFRGKRLQNTCIAQNEELLKLCLILNSNHKQYHHVQSNIIIKFCERLRGLLTVINNLISDATYLSLFSFFSYLRNVKIPKLYFHVRWYFPVWIYSFNWNIYYVFLISIQWHFLCN